VYRLEPRYMYTPGTLSELVSIATWRYCSMAGYKFVVARLQYMEDSSGIYSISDFQKEVHDWFSIAGERPLFFETMVQKDVRVVMPAGFGRSGLLVHSSDHSPHIPSLLRFPDLASSAD